jgi:hypothetical protein
MGLDNGCRLVFRWLKSSFIKDSAPRLIKDSIKKRRPEMATAPKVAEDKIAVEDGRLIVDVALTGGVPSASGKSVVYFSTSGNSEIDGGYVIGINLYRKRVK